MAIILLIDRQHYVLSANDSAWAGGQAADLVASGFEEIWGRLRNSSRSIVPELSLSSFMNLFRILSTSSRSKFEPCTMFSNIALLALPILTDV